MNKMPKKNFIPYAFVFLYLLIYGILSYRFLHLFPLVHSDESWLAGLSRNMAETMDFSVTESFFNARPRYPHAIKILFHGLQVLFLSLFGYSPETFRLISLLAGLLVLFLIYKTALHIFRDTSFAFGIMVLFSLDIQFIYASHFARQEILLLLVLVSGFYLFFKTDRPYTVKKAVSLGLLTGLSVGLHPNSFLIACTLFFCYAGYCLHLRCKNFRPLFAYIGVTGATASVFVAVSYSFDPQFLTHYFANGSLEFDIDASFATRLSGLCGYFGRLFSRTGGTYYVADIRLQFILFLLAALFLLFFYMMMKKEESRLCGTLLCLLFSGLGTISGIFIIGRFSQLSIVFLFPAGWLFVAFLIKLLDPAAQKICLFLLSAVVFFLSAKEIRPYLQENHYETYINQISAFVTPEDKVLGNLNMDFYFENGALLDYRNLPYVMEQDGSLDRYITENNIACIFYTDELTYYYEHRPYYNTLYGNIMFADALKTYCESQCEFLGTFENPQYAPRIQELIGKEEYGTVFVYKTNLKTNKDPE